MRKSLKKQTSFKEDVDVYYYEDSASTAANSSTASDTIRDYDHQLAASHELFQFGDDVADEPAEKVFAAENGNDCCSSSDCSSVCQASSSSQSLDKFRNDADTLMSLHDNEQASGILCRYGSSDSVTEIRPCDADANSFGDGNMATTRNQITTEPNRVAKKTNEPAALNNSCHKVETPFVLTHQPSPSSAPSFSSSSSTSRSVSKESIRPRKYMLQSINEGDEKTGAQLAGTVTVTKGGDVGEMLRAVIYMCDRPTRDVKTVVRAMSDGRAIVVTTYETDVLNSTPPRVEKITLPVQVDPFSMKALVQRQGPLVIEAPVIRS